MEGQGGPGGVRLTLPSATVVYPTDLSFASIDVVFRKSTQHPAASLVVGEVDLIIVDPRYSDREPA